MKPTQEMITIVGDGITVTARKYVDGELTCSARCPKKHGAAYNFDKQATDAMYALMAKQNDRAIEYCHADVDNTKEYYEYRKAHPEMFPEEQEDDEPECDEPECDVQDEATKYPKIYQSVADIADDANLIYYAGRPEVFWKDFKQGKFIIKVSHDDWSGLAASAKPYDVRWISGCELDVWKPPFECLGSDILYIGTTNSDFTFVAYCKEPKNFKVERCIAWDDIKDTFKTTDASTNDAKDTPIPWKDIMDRNCIIKVRKQDWKKFAEQAAANNLIWTTGETFSVEDVYPGYHLDLDAVYIGCAEIDHGLVWSTFHESFHIPEIIHFSRWCDND